MIQEYLTDRQVAEVTGRSLSSIRNDRHLHKGFSYVKIGKSIRYKKEDVINYMESRKITPEVGEENK